MTLQQIEQKATDLLKDLEQLTFPVPVKKIIKELDVDIQADDLGEEISGLLVIEDGRALIGYNSDEPIVRQRFTLAHELGHYILHCNRNNRNKIFVDKIMYRKNFSSTSEKRQEMQANTFAAALLMPEILIEQEFNRLLNSSEPLTEEDIIEELSSGFKVSAISMTYRLINLNLLSR